MRISDLDGDVGAPLPAVQAWCREIDEALKREKDWRKEARRQVELYECGKKDEYQFNILYSNTETLVPALYNNLPRPVVQRRFKDEDRLGELGSRVVQRSLEYLLDNDVGTYTPFDDLIAQSVLEACVPGRGVVRFKYDATFVKSKAEVINEETGEVETVEEESLDYETVCGELVPWDRFLHGYAKQWKDVPWVAFEHIMDRTELEKNFGEAGRRVKLSISGNGADQDTDDKREMHSVDDAEGMKFAQVWEIWDKDTRKVLFISKGSLQEILREVDDPLGLSGFFPMPRPLDFFPKINSLVPVTLYSAYEEQAKELNRVTVRINKIVNALKVRGFYDGTVDGIDKVLQAEDNVLIPAENVAALQQGQSLEKSIWLMPLTELVTVLQQLYLQRQQTKQVIYEITGISDILRGASTASETATAQNIKNQWGTLRLKRLQKRVMKYVRDSLRIMAEIAVTKLNQDTIAAMTGLDYPTAEQKAQGEQILAQMRQQMQQQAAMAQAQGQPPQQPQMPPQAQAIQEMLSQPTWEDLLGMLQNDIQRNYQIDIETNSTVDAEATEDKQNMGEFLNAVAQFMNGVGPLVMQGVMPFEAAKSILLAVTRRYRFGTEVEDQIRMMQAPQPQEEKPDPKAQIELQKAQMEIEDRQQERQFKIAEMQAESQLKQAEMQAKMQELNQKTEFAATQHALKMEQMRAQREMKILEMRAKLAAPQDSGNSATVTTE